MKYIYLLVILVTGAVSAQTWFPMRERAVLEYKYYNNKGRALSYGDVVVGRDEVVFENVMWTFLPENLAYTVDYGEYDVNPWEGTMNATARFPLVLNIGDTLPEMHYKAVLEEQVTPDVGLVRREKMNGTGRRIDEVMMLESVEYQ